MSIRGLGCIIGYHATCLDAAADRECGCPCHGDDAGYGIVKVDANRNVELVRRYDATANRELVLRQTRIMNQDRSTPSTTYRFIEWLK